MSKWKEASSLIISAACRSQVTQKASVSKLTDVDKCNFQILSLKKRSESTIKPQLCVFPGGSVSPADSVREWEKLFSSFGLSISELSKLVHGNELNLPIFYDRKEDIPRWLSLRITAIRETFEECGILLCRDQTSECPYTENSWMQRPTANYLEINEIDKWRSMVLDDPFQFISLCQQFSCYPDVESLFLWSNWLTPSHLSERFDAVFFIANVNSLAVYRVSPDYKEISSTEWLKPEELMDLSSKSKIWLKPPQWYEINTLVGMRDFDDLHNYSYHRSSNCLRWMPVRIITDDGEVSLLPGDEMYPSEVDLFKLAPILRKQVTMESLRCELMHRMEHSGVKTCLLDTRSGR